MLKPTHFHNVNPNVIKGLKYWFCFREVYLVFFYLLKELMGNKKSWLTLRFYMLFLFLPFLLIFVLPFDARNYPKNVLSTLEEEDQEPVVPIFSKKNVEYMKMMTMLSNNDVYIEEEK